MSKEDAARLQLSVPHGMAMSDRMPGAASLVGLYVHVPFCASRCGYCDFNTYAGLDGLIEGYAGALEWEMGARASEARAVRTVYLGGGTPTHLRQRTLERLLHRVFSIFEVQQSAEVTIEMNPGDADLHRLQRMRKAGVNRISIGAQSFDDRLLALLQRRHSVRETREAVLAARAAGFDNISLDLMYGIPGQTLEAWERTLEEAIALAPEHVSTYSLTIEPGTPFAALREQGLIEKPSHEEEADMYQAACSMLERAGYEHYEVSNFALPGRRCRHNEAYWRGDEYLGVGAGAHSYLGGVRWWNAKHPREYIALVRSGAPPVAGMERLSEQGRMQESLMLGLRLAQGVSADEFRSRHGRDLRKVYGRGIEQAAKAGLVRCADGGVALTRRGMMLGDRAAAQILGGCDD